VHSHTFVLGKLITTIFAQALADDAVTTSQLQAKSAEFLFQQAHDPGTLMAGAQFSQQAGIGEKAAVPVEMVEEWFDAGIRGGTHQTYRVVPTLPAIRPGSAAAKLAGRLARRGAKVGLIDRKICPESR
jgi:hypothetical protein